MRPQPQQRLGGTDIELSHDHAGGLVHLDAVQERRGRPPAPGLAHALTAVESQQVEQRQRGELGSQQAPGQVGGAEPARGEPIQVQGGALRRADGDRQRVHRPHPELPRRLTVGGPPGLARVLEVRHEDRVPVPHGVQARPFAEGELELVEAAAEVVAGAERAPGGPVVGDRQCRTVDAQHPHAGPAQAVHARRVVDREPDSALQRGPNVGWLHDAALSPGRRSPSGSTQTTVLRPLGSGPGWTCPAASAGSY